MISLEAINEYKLECYQIIRPLSQRENLWLVRESVTEENFVMHKLPAPAEEIYRVLSEIHHPAIVEILDVFSCDGFTYVIEEFLDWKRLADVLEEKGPFRKRAVSIAVQLLEALEILHAHGVVHRDIKPENILMNESGEIKLIDFDIARLFSEDKSHDTTVKGTKSYAPPEQFGFSQSDFRADIYSAGVTLNELAIGKLPEEKLCSGRLGKIIRRCTELDPKRRYQSAMQALTQLKRMRWKLKVTTVSSLILLLSILLFAALPLLRRTVELLPTEDLSDLTESVGEIDEPPSSGETEPVGGIDESPSSGETESAGGIDKPPSGGDTESVGEIDELVSMEELSDLTEYADGIVRMSAVLYPAILLSEDGQQAFKVDLEEEIYILVSIMKEQEQLTVSMTRSDGEKTEFRFGDNFRDICAQFGYDPDDLDVSGKEPHYELLFSDLDEDEIYEIIVTLAWREQIETPRWKDRFYRAEYSILWTIHLTEENSLECSQPIYFYQDEPHLQNGWLLYDYGLDIFHDFQDGEWTTVNW